MRHAGRWRESISQAALLPGRRPCGFCLHPGFVPPEIYQSFRSEAVCIRRSVVNYWGDIRARAVHRGLSDLSLCPERRNTAALATGATETCRTSMQGRPRCVTLRCLCKQRCKSSALTVLCCATVLCYCVQCVVPLVLRTDVHQALMNPHTLEPLHKSRTR